MDTFYAEAMPVYRGQILIITVTTSAETLGRNLVLYTLLSQHVEIFANESARTAECITYYRLRNGRITRPRGAIRQVKYVY